MRFPDIPPEYLPDFIRGYFDGDGSIILRKTKYNMYAQISFTSGSKDFLLRLQSVLEQHYHIASHLYKDGRVNNQSYYLRITKRGEIYKLYDILYDDTSLFLNRKYQKFLLFLSCKPKYNT